MAKTKAVDGLRFEEAFQELTELVAKLEAGDLPLEQSLALFERGQALAQRCGELLENAELKLRKLIEDESGEFTESELEVEDE